MALIEHLDQKQLVEKDLFHLYFSLREVMAGTQTGWGPEGGTKQKL